MSFAMEKDEALDPRLTITKKTALFQNLLQNDPQLIIPQKLCSTKSRLSFQYYTFNSF
jgi:hypothetical protein